MAYQNLFRTKYVDSLIQEVEQGANLERYYGYKFHYDEHQVLSAPALIRPEGLLYKMDSSDNCRSAIALFEAYPKLSALQAADSRLWVYLAVADLFQYVREKWALQIPAMSDPDRIEKMRTNIRIHWFGLQKDSTVFNPMRHALANLWWSVYSSIDRKAPTVYETYKYTRLLFKNETFRTRTAVGFLGRNREALFGILDFAERNPELFDSKSEIAFREITKFFNCLGGTIQLSFMKRDFFLQQLLSRKNMLKEKVDERASEKQSVNGPNLYSDTDSTTPASTSVSEPEYTDYINVRKTVTSMINKNN